MMCGAAPARRLRKSMTLDGGKSFPVIHKYLGRIYMRKQMNKAAVTEFETYLSLLPTAKDAELFARKYPTLNRRNNKIDASDLNESTEIPSTTLSASIPERTKAVLSYL